MKSFAGILFAIAIAMAMATASAQDNYAAARAKMVDEIAAMARDTAAETGRPVFGVRVMKAMATVETRFKWRCKKLRTP